MSIENPYKIFGIKESFILDLGYLEDMYLKLQISNNPDTVNSLDKNNAQKNTIQINNAYQILKDPMKRAEFLLGFFCDFDCKEDISKDQLFLTEIMDTIERNDHITKKEIIDNLWQELEKSFQNQNWQQAKSCYLKISYFKKNLFDNN
jgi:molecular chaperone HscB